MKIKIPLYRQKTDFDCGPATWKMVLGYFGMKVSLERLIRELRTTEATGTTRRDMVRIARQYGLCAEPKTGASIADLRRCLVEGRLAVVNYVMPGWEVSHYAVVSGLTGGRILLNDPYEGAHFNLKLDEFLKRWRGWHRTANRHWLMEVSRRTSAARS